MASIKVEKNKSIQCLLYIFLFATSLNPLISFVLNINDLHLIIIVIMFFILFFKIILRGKIEINKLLFPILLYVIMVILGLFSVDFNVRFAIQALSYRVLFPFLFLMLFTIYNTSNSIKLIDLNVIKIINVICIILAIFGLVEKNNPKIIHMIYGEGLTTHLSLLLNGERSTRLLSLSGNPINLGFYMAIGVGSALILIVMNLKKSKVLVIMDILSISLFVYVMFYTYSRSAALVSLVIGATLFIVLFSGNGMKSKVAIVLISIILYVFVSKILFSVDSISSRFDSISLTHYFENTRFMRAYMAFNKDTDFVQLLFGHGIREINISNSYVFELGYASLLYESGIIGFIIVVGSFISGILSGIKLYKKEYKENNGYITAFYIAIIVGGLAGMFVEDLYMQQPFNMFLWFSTISLVSAKNK